MPRSRNPRIATYPLRPKRDPRLSFLLSLPRAELRALKSSEDRTRGESERFVPMTTGVFFPSTSRAADRLPGGFKEPYASVFILSDASAADLAKLGARVRSQMCDVFTAFVPLSRLEALEASPAVRYLELAQAMRPTLDQATPYAKIDTLHNTVPATNGTGVVVGIVDVIFDIYHPDFRTADGRTRVFWFWDQALTPQGQEHGPDVSLLSPMPFGGQTYGVEYDQSAIDRELSNFNPPNNYTIVRQPTGIASHGTHVAGIAVGNGLAQNKAFVGGAPGANIIFVRPPQYLTQWTTDSAIIADALAYIFARADQLGQPCVVNVSLVLFAGPRDGTRLVEQFFDGLLLKPGRAITVAAGNDNDPQISNARMHAMGTVPQGGTVDVVLRYGPQAALNEQIEVWYSGPDTFDVTVIVEDQQLGIPQTPIGPLGPGLAVTTALPGGYTVNVSSVAQDMLNLDRVIYVWITVPAGSRMPTAWTIRLNGTVVVNGTFHAWLSSNNAGLGGWNIQYSTADVYSLSIPGTARRVITVGNHDKTGPPPAIFPDSSHGPTRDGRIKPEIATVGTQVTSARSRNMNDPNPGPFYTQKGGTSMAAPLVAGACALLFQCRGATATWSDLTSILKNTAAPMSNVNAFGAGYMQMGVACMPPPTAVDVWLRDAQNDSGLEPSVNPVWWLSPDIEVLDRNGIPVANPKYDPNVPFNNIIRVTARNRGMQAALDTHVYLYWADPATYLPFTLWSTSGFFVNGPGFGTTGNRILIPQIAVGGSVPVEFAWAPPTPGSNIRRDAHFCLIARLENAGDPSAVGPGGWGVITGKNNVAIRNVYVQQSPAEMTFYVIGTDDEDSLVVIGNVAGGRVELSLPVQALPWRNLRLLQHNGHRRLPYGGGPPADDPLATVDASLEGDEVRRTTDIAGAASVRVRAGIATIVSKGRATIEIPCLRVAMGARMSVRLGVSRPRATEELRDVHVAQLSGGRRAGGVTLRLAIIGDAKQRP
jgi:subtilisin family serine protease